jgi:NADH-quinone oxidoreductase subunit N
LSDDLFIIAPLIVAVLTAAAVLIVDLIRPGHSALAIGTAMLGLGATAAVTIVVGASPGTAFGGSYTVDSLTTFLDILFIAIVVMTILFAPDYLLPRSLPVAEFAIVLIFAMCGAMLIAGSADLLLLFIGVELIVLPVYLLAGFL